MSSMQLAHAHSARGYISILRLLLVIVVLILVEPREGEKCNEENSHREYFKRGLEDVHLLYCITCPECARQSAVV